MQIGNDRYFRDRLRNDLALRMIRHEARTCTIRACTGLSDDRIRRLYQTYGHHGPHFPRRRRGKSPRNAAFFTRNTQVQFESSFLMSVFKTFDLLSDTVANDRLAFGRLFCDAYETHRQLLSDAGISFEHAWFLLTLTRRASELAVVRCRHCDSQFVRDTSSATRHTCPVCRLKRRGMRRQAAPCVGPTPSIVGSA
jgi:DnaJ-class molecular chaperone